MCMERGIVTPAREVDHIIPIVERPDLRLDPSNLRPLCTSCHSARTATEQGFAKGGRKREGCDRHGHPPDWR